MVTASVRSTRRATEKLVLNNDIVLIDTVTPVANEATHNGWVFCRPTEGPHTRRALVIRQEYFVPNAVAR